MKRRTRQLCTALIATIGACATSAAVAEPNPRQPQPAVGLVKVIQQSTQQYQNASIAASDGYVNLGSCVSGETGAAGVHYANVGLLGDGVLDPARPEILVYEPTAHGGKRLVAVEYLVFAGVWDDAHPSGEAPAVMGQLMDYHASPNRFRLPASYVLHVWAWKDNPDGVFANFNSRASCEYYEGEG